jgi:Carboxypeptidase regulatory-like domain
MPTTRYLYGVLLSCVLLTACDNDNNNNNNNPGQPEPPAPTAVAREATQESDLLQGPLARSALGDFVLENELFRVIIQQPGRNWFAAGTYGGNIIDVSRKQDDGSFLPDHLEEFTTGLNIENTPNYTEVAVTNPGADGEAAQICARGPDDLLEFFNASSIIRNIGFPYPPSADDRDLPLEIETCYSLEANQPYLTMDTRLINTSSEEVAIWWVEYLNGSGEVQAYQPQAGFGEPLLTSGCPVATAVACDGGECDQCNYLAYAGHEGAAGVSYGLIHEEIGTTSFSSDGFNILVLGTSLLNIVGGTAPNFTVPGDGEFTLRRYFAVGDGSASSIADIRNQIDGIHTGELAGTVSSQGEPVANASVAVFKTINGNSNPPTLFMAGSAFSDADGNYRMSLPPGDYEMQANAEGYLYASDQPAAVSIVEEQTVEQNFSLPEPGYLQVSVVATALDGGSEAGPAKLQVVGFDPSPALENNVGGNVAGVFGDTSDPLPYGVTLVSFIDRNGSSERLTLEPGDYQLVLSRGPRYSAYKKSISVASGQVTEVQAELAQVVATEGYVHGDFHVHAIDSVDAEVTRSERVATYLAEGVDFFTPSDHGIRVSFTDTIRDMDVADLIGTAPSAEITTFDYGHFNSWPVTIDASKISGGSVDWGREAQPGMDFPAFASYGLSPAELIDAALSDPRENIVQINHIESYFGTGGLSGGLGIDTGKTPPQSTVDPTTRRLDPSLANSFDDGFQALEVWIGTEGRSGLLDAFLGENAGDWFNLINQGLVRTGVANSDTHETRTTYLSARNQIASAVTDPGQLSDRAEILAATVAAGKVIGTNAPFMTIQASGSFQGAATTADLSIDGSTGMAVSAGTEVLVTVHLSTPLWAGVDTVDFYINNQPELTSKPGEAPRYGICPDFSVTAGDPGWSATEVVVDEAISGAARTDIEVTLRLSFVNRDTWLVAIAHGSDGLSEPMFPVVPEDLDQVSNTTLEDLTDGNLGEGGILAYAFSNPLFFDVNGDGWTAPGVANASCSP